MNDIALSPKYKDTTFQVLLAQKTYGLEFAFLKTLFERINVSHLGRLYKYDKKALTLKIETNTDFFLKRKPLP